MGFYRPIGISSLSFTSMSAAIGLLNFFLWLTYTIHDSRRNVNKFSELLLYSVCNMRQGMDSALHLLFCPGCRLFQMCIALLRSLHLQIRSPLQRSQIAGRCTQHLHGQQISLRIVQRLLQ